MDKLFQYIDKASKSVFRYEGLQDYSAEDGQESVREFMKSGKLPFISSESKWWQDIKLKNEQGIKTCRVRMVEKPLTDYTKMELALHVQSALFSSEDIRIIEKDIILSMATQLEDFYLVDDEHLFVLKYGPNGKYLGSSLVSGNVVKEYLGYKKKMIDLSIPVYEYIK